MEYLVQLQQNSTAVQYGHHIQVNLVITTFTWTGALFEEYVINNYEVYPLCVLDNKGAVCLAAFCNTSQKLAWPSD